MAFAGRAFTESVNDGDMEAADRAWAMLVPGCKGRYGLSLDAISALPPRVSRVSNLAGILGGALLWEHGDAWSAAHRGDLRNEGSTDALSR